jgi:hypothetical protein
VDVTGLGARLRGARTELLTLGGFSSLTASAWVAFGLAAGLAALGVSALVVEFLTGDEERRR